MKAFQILWTVSVAMSLGLLIAAGGEEEKSGIFELDLSAAEVGSEPEGLFVVDGEFIAGVVDGVKALELKAEPLAEGLVLLGESLRGGGTIRARVEAKKRGRSYPRFGAGLHGISGYRLRVVPARKVIEVVVDEESVAEMPFAWSDEEATWLELKIRFQGEGRWALEGRVWSEGAEKPEEPLIAMLIEENRFSGKGVLSGTPYAGLPIRFHDVRIEAEADPVSTN